MIWGHNPYNPGFSSPFNRQFYICWTCCYYFFSHKYLICLLINLVQCQQNTLRWFKIMKNTLSLIRTHSWKHKDQRNSTQVMSGGFLMFPKIVSETGICFTKASIYLTGMDFLCKHRLSDSVVAPEDWMLNPWQELRPSTTEKKEVCFFFVFFY